MVFHHSLIQEAYLLNCKATHVLNFIAEALNPLTRFKPDWVRFSSVEGLDATLEIARGSTMQPAFYYEKGINKDV